MKYGEIDKVCEVSNLFVSVENYSVIAERLYSSGSSGIIVDNSNRLSAQKRACRTVVELYGRVGEFLMLELGFRGLSVTSYL